MSCLHPIQIKNPTKRYGAGVTKAILTVPCGVCEECRKAKQKEWALRAYTLMQDTVKRGGFTLFPTLTYNNANLPRFHYEDWPNEYHIPAFNKKHYEKFANSLRKKYERKGIYGVKVLVCCEYGRKTRRPHYHALIYFPDGVTKGEAMNDIKHYWSYGYVMWSELGPEVNSLAGCMYVSKYVCKDLDYYDRKDLKDFMIRYSTNEEAMQAIKPYLPKHWLSKGFGLSLLEKFNSIKDKEELFRIIRDGMRIPLTETLIKLPRYIHDKIMYRTDEQGVRILSDFNKEYLVWNYDYSIDQAAKQLQYDISTEGLKQFITDKADIYTKFPEFKYMGLDSIEKVCLYLHLFKENISFRALAVYQKVFLGYTSLTRYYKDMIDMPYDANYFDYAKQIFLMRLYLPEEEKCYMLEGYLTYYRKEFIQTDWDDLFADYRLFFNVLNFVKRYGYSKRSKAQTTKEKVIKNIRELFKENMKIND